MADTLTNLASAPLVPVTILAPTSEFLALTGGMPTAAKMRSGTEWVGLNGTYGTISKVSLKPMGDRKAQAGSSPGAQRAAYWTALGFALSMTVHNDRGCPTLRKGDRFTCWIDPGTGTWALTYFHVEDLSEDMGDEDTVTLEITAEHRVGLDDQTSMIRATVDELGRVYSYDTATKFAGSVADPSGALPTGPTGSQTGTWTRSGTTITVTKASHGLTTSDNIMVYSSSDETATPTGSETVTVTDASTFTFVGVNAGATSGTITFAEV